MAHLYGKQHQYDSAFYFQRKALNFYQQSENKEGMGPDFPKGLFVLMSTDRTFHLYRWEDIAGKELSVIQ